MFKFKKLIKIVAGIILINLIACDSFKNSLDISNTNSVISSKTINTSNISSDLIALPKKTKSKLEAHISSSAKNTLADYYNESYIDSLRSILIETGSLKINVFESFLIDTKNIVFFEFILKESKFFFKSLVFNKSEM